MWQKMRGDHIQDFWWYYHRSRITWTHRYLAGNSHVWSSSTASICTMWNKNSSFAVFLDVWQWSQERRRRRSVFVIFGTVWGCSMLRSLLQGYLGIVVWGRREMWGERDVWGGREMWGKRETSQVREIERERTNVRAATLCWNWASTEILEWMRYVYRNILCVHEYSICTWDSWMNEVCVHEYIRYVHIQTSMCVSICVCVCLYILYIHTC